MLFTNILIYDILGTSFVLVIVLVAYCKWTLTYWKRKGLEGLKPSIPYGDIRQTFSGEPFTDTLLDMYKKLKSKSLKHAGIYLTLRPVYMPIDLEIINGILKTHFNYFSGHLAYVNEEIDPLTGNLFYLKGSKWKGMRSKLTPGFTTAKLKMFFDTILKCSEALINTLENVSDSPVDISYVFEQYSSNLMGNCCFGIDLSTINSWETHFFLECPKYKVFRNAVLDLLIPHWVLRLFKYNSFDLKFAAALTTIVEKVLSYKKENIVQMNNIVELLNRQLSNQITVGDGNYLTASATEKTRDVSILNNIVAQNAALFVAGSDTTSLTLSLAIYELAIWKDIQNCAREEVINTLEESGNTLTYAAVMNMTYLDKIINETLRKYPPVDNMNRVCEKAFKVPGTDIKLDKGTLVVVPVRGIHYDPSYYPNPEVFDPERFSEQNKNQIPAGAWIPFGDGPRKCTRLAYISLKAALAMLLKNFDISLDGKTQEPLKFYTRGLTVACKSSIWVNVQKRAQ